MIQYGSVEIDLGDSKTIADVMDKFQEYRIGGDRSNMINEGASRSESVLEDTLWHFLRKLGGGYDSIAGQYQCGKYRVDVVLKAGELKIGLEVDGAKYHDEQKDLIRDREIIAGGHLDDIVRIPYAAITYYPYATLGCLELWYGEVFAFRHPNDCISIDEMKAEFEKWNDHSEWHRQCMEPQFWDWMNNAEIYYVNGNVGFAGEYKQIQNNHNVRRILRRTKRDCD